MNLFFACETDNSRSLWDGTMTLKWSFSRSTRYKTTLTMTTGRSCYLHIWWTFDMQPGSDLQGQTVLFLFFFCKIFKKNQALTNFLTCVQSLKKTFWPKKNKTSNNTTGINKRFVLAKYDPFHSREKTGTDWWLVRHVHVQLCKWRTRWINNTVPVHTLSITMKKNEKNKKSFYRPFKPVGSTSMEKGKAERERLKKRRTKRDTYTFSNSMVLQQALGALRVHIPIKLFCESCEQGVGLEGKKNNAWNFNPLRFFFFFFSSHT